MRILLIHQYFLEKGDGGGSRFNEMTQVWADQSHDITVLAGNESTKSTAVSST